MSIGEEPTIQEYAASGTQAKALQINLDAAYLRRYTHNHIALPMGIPTLAALFEEKYYTDLEGGILEAFGRLFKGAIKLHIYPWRNAAGGDWVTAQTFKAPPALRHLYAHLLENKFIEPIAGPETQHPDLLPRVTHYV